MKKTILCPVCGKTAFAAAHDYDICPICGWENDGELQGGGANRLSLAAYRERFAQCLLRDPGYRFDRDGAFPDSTREEKGKGRRKRCKTDGSC